MKKIALIIISILVLFASCKKDEKFIPNNGIVNFISGKVSIIDNNKKIKASSGMIIKKGMKISTGKNSLIDIYFGKNVIRILSSSIVSMKELTKEINSNSEILEFYVEKGKIFSKVSRKLKSGEKFSVSTPTVTAGVRGTQFLVEEGKKKSKISCLEGTVAVKKADEKDKDAVDVHAGKEANVAQDSQITLEDLKKDNLDRINKIKDDIREIQKDIKEKFEKQRDEIRQVVKDQKEKNKKMIEDQKNKDKQNIQKIKDDMKGKTQAIKQDTEKTKTEAKDAVKNFKKPDMKSFKPDMKKFKSEKK